MAEVVQSDHREVGERLLAESSVEGLRVALPADYVNQDASLAYALTVHKAQGVTVDRAVLIADEATTAETLYVGMTRGRHHNTPSGRSERCSPRRPRC